MRSGANSTTDGAYEPLADESMGATSPRQWVRVIPGLVYRTHCHDGNAMEIFTLSNILTGCGSEGAADAIRRVGGMLAGFGYVRDNYVKGLLERGEAGGQVKNGIAVISAAHEYDQYIAAPGMVVATYPEGVPWNGADVHAVVGIAAIGEILGQMTKCALSAFPDSDAVRAAVAAGDAEALFAAFSSGKGASV